MSAAARSDACDDCLRRAYLVGHLAPRIAALLAAPRRAISNLLALSDEELIAAAGGRAKAAAHAFLGAFDPAARRDDLSERRLLALCLHAEAYPPLLRQLTDAPRVLFGLGCWHALAALHDEPAVAVVGTRRPSPYGTEVAGALGRGLGAAGLPVVSGLALGVDATAHRGCLDAHGLPVAVLACGPDVVYPRRHRELHERVREEGLVLAELPPGTRPFRWSFPARNRIMAGLARMTIVVEAAEPSGSLITSEFARDLGRSVAAVPGRVTSRVARGSNRLIRDGAVPILGTADVLDELFGVGVRAPGPQLPAEPELRAVLEAAESTSSIASLAEATGLDTATVRSALGRLEAAGHLVRVELGGWERAAW